LIREIGHNPGETIVPKMEQAGLKLRAFRSTPVTRILIGQGK
jgi:hypothetical protein